MKYEKIVELLGDDDEKCAIELRKMLDKEPGDPLVHYYLSIALDNLDKRNEAREKFETAKELFKKNIQNDPKNIDSRKMFVDFYSTWEYYEEAEKECKDALAISPNDAELHYQLGDVLYNLKKYEEAEKEYRVAIELDPNNPEYHYYFGFLLAEHFGNYNDGVKEIEKAIEIRPDEAWYLELSYLFGLNEGISKYLELWKKLLEATGSNEAKKNLNSLSLSGRYEKDILCFIDSLRNTNIPKFDILINDQKISVIETSKAPDTTRIWEEDSRFIKLFHCYIGDRLFRIFIYYSIRPSQGYMIYVSFNNPRMCRIEFNLSKMLKRSQPQQIGFLYNLLFALQDDKNKERKKRGLEACKNLGLDVVEDTISLGSYSLDKSCLINKTYEIFLKDIVKLSLIKGHFSNIIRISSLPEINKTEEEDIAPEVPTKRERRSIPSEYKHTVAEFDLLSSVKEKILEIKAFLDGSSIKSPSNDKLCFWLWFCYEFGLYQEGALLFRKIDEDSVSQDLYRMIREIGSACERRFDAI